MRAILLSVVTALAMLAQQGTPTPPPEPAKQERPVDPVKPLQPNEPAPRPHQQAPRFYRIEGRVFMSVGGPPPDTVAVTAICAGQLVAKGTTTSKGGYSLQVGALSGQMMDSSVSRSIGGPGLGANTADAPANDCEVSAALDGFRAEPVRVGTLQSMQITRADVVLKPIANINGYTFSGTTLNASREAREAWEKGTRALAKKKEAEAERELRRAVNLYPKFAVAWYELGRLLNQNGQLAAARGALESAIAADPKYINPYPVLAQLDVAERRWEDLARHTGQLIALHPVFSADIYLFCAQANLVLDRLDAAEKHAREALELDRERRLPVTRRILARVLAKQGRNAEAIEQLELYLQRPAADAEVVRAEIANLRK